MRVLLRYVGKCSREYGEWDVRLCKVQVACASSDCGGYCWWYHDVMNAVLPACGLPADAVLSSPLLSCHPPETTYRRTERTEHRIGPKLAQGERRARGPKKRAASRKKNVRPWVVGLLAQGEHRGRGPKKNVVSISAIFFRFGVVKFLKRTICACIFFLQEWWLSMKLEKDT